MTHLGESYAELDMSTTYTFEIISHSFEIVEVNFDSLYCSLKDEQLYGGDNNTPFSQNDKVCKDIFMGHTYMVPKIGYH